MPNPSYFIDKNLKVEFKITLDSHHNNQANSKLTITPNYPQFGIEVLYINEIIKQLSVIYARLKNQYKYKYQTVFPARFDKQDEDNQVLDETELFINLNITHKLTESDLDNVDIKCPLEHQIQQQERKNSGWRFDNVNSMMVCFFKTIELNGSNYVKFPLRSNAILNIEKNDKYCSMWSIKAKLHPCNNNHPKRVSNYKQYFIELNIEGFDFTNGFRCSDVHKFNEINNLSKTIFELNFYQDQNKWRHKLVPVEVIKINSDRFVDLLIHKNQYSLFEKLNVFFGDHNKKFICRRCLSSYTTENML